MKTRIQVINQIQDEGLIPVFYHPDTEVVKKVLKACYDGGARIFEFTNRYPLAQKVFEALRLYTMQEMPDLILGIGTVLEAGTTSMYIQLGADFVVSPVVNKDMAKVCHRRKVLWIPGCATVSEISKAEEKGAEFVKVFPAEQLGGADFVKAIKAPCPWTNVIVTGGVLLEEVNLQNWFQAGVSAVGMSTKLIPYEAIQTGNYEAITQNVKVCLEMIQNFKNLER
jgi:2-dehydro-3-deoxyphosphogluconate aldolase / (4S)-4-hydroxy-2-oxoglutarate aldolase